MLCSKEMVLVRLRYLRIEKSVELKTTAKLAYIGKSILIGDKPLEACASEMKGHCRQSG